MKSEYKSNNNIVYSCKYHVVWCPKYRRQILVRNIETVFKDIVATVCDQYNIELIEMEVMPDHVHLLINVDPQFGIDKAIRILKGRSSYILRREFPELKICLPSLWTNSYFVSTVGGASLDVVKKYIENQKA